MTEQTKDRVSEALASVKPTKKVTGATAGYAISAIVGYVLVSYVGLEDFPVEALELLGTFLGGWLPTESDRHTS